MHSPDGRPLQIPLPGQYVVIRIQITPSGSPLFRSYSLSGPLSTERYRISVKIEPNGVAGTYLREQVRVSDTLDVSSPRGSFILQSGERPVVLRSAGIGATPLLAMLHAPAEAHSTRQILWVHAARDGQHHPFSAEVRSLVTALANGRTFICYSKPNSRDKLGEHFDTAGHLSRAIFDNVGVIRDADVYLCGPARFMADMKEMLPTLGVAQKQIHIEIFNGSESMTPGVVQPATRAPHPPKDDADTDPLVSFARSGIAARWNPSAYQSLLELAEGCDVPVRWSCRTGVCHTVRAVWFRER
jgi:Flavodoxin reductases (ferredoxin-NADPH reductases) family 1